MKIIKYQKSKKNTYLVTIDNQEYSLYDDIIIKYNLLLKKEITKNELVLILKANQELDCYYEALKYLSHKMRTKKEVIKYLDKKFAKDEINKCINKLVKEKYIDEDVYINAYLSDCLRFSSEGKLKIKQKLINLGLDKELIINKLNEIPDLTWQEKCDKLALKKVNANHKDSKQLIINKVKNYLLNNGYELKYIENTLSKIKIETNRDVLNKEYLKIKNKLSKKYDGSNLEFQVKMKLIAKGYTVDEINNFVK